MSSKAKISKARYIINCAWPAPRTIRECENFLASPIFGRLEIEGFLDQMSKVKCISYVLKNTFWCRHQKKCFMTMTPVCPLLVFDFHIASTPWSPQVIYASYRLFPLTFGHSFAEVESRSLFDVKKTNLEVGRPRSTTVLWRRTSATTTTVTISVTKFYLVSVI